MGGAQQPFLYQGEVNNDAKFPISTFDPKAVTRMSYEVKPKKAKPDGPLVAFNRHPDAHVIPSQRALNHKPMSRRTKSLIKGIRVVQLILRILELVGAAGLLFLMVVLSNVDTMVSWVIRITTGIVIVHCIYGIFHLARPASGKTPGSSAAYHTFAGIWDLCVLPLYAYGALNARQNGGAWTTILANPSLLSYFIPSFYYGLIGAGGLHLLSLSISLYLGVMFRRITLMPPDMNPLEDHLTTRTATHKRNKSSIYTESSDRRSVRSSNRNSRSRAGTPTSASDESARPRSVPFMHTRQGSDTTTLRPGTRDSRADLPSRQYQIEPRNSYSPRSSRVGGGGEYMELPLSETGGRGRPVSAYGLHQGQGHSRPGSRDASKIAARPMTYFGGMGSSHNNSPNGGSIMSGGRPSSGTVASYHVAQTEEAPPTPEPRTAKFSEAWYASESLITRTQQRKRAMMLSVDDDEVNGGKVREVNVDAERRSAYEALNGRYDGEESDSEGEDGGHDASGIFMDRDEDGDDLGDLGRRGNGGRHPNPLRSNPSLTSSSLVSGPERPYTPYHATMRNSILSELSQNERRVTSSGSIVSINIDGPSVTSHPQAAGKDIADEKAGLSGSGNVWQPRNRNSSIQPETEFYSKPYGELPSRTPPIMESSLGAERRQVSSGIDYFEGLSGPKNGKFGRRNVSGKIAEEGRAGSRFD